MIVKVFLAIVVGVIATGLMEWLTDAPHGLDVAIGIAAGLLFYFTWDGPRRVV